MKQVHLLGQARFPDHIATRGLHHELSDRLPSESLFARFDVTVWWRAGSSVLMVGPGWVISKPFSAEANRVERSG